jgi:hypothetical protein
MEIVSKLLVILLQPEVLAVVGPVVVALVLRLLRAAWKEKAENRERLLEAGIEIAYQCVNDVSKLTPNTVDDKVAMGLGYLREWLGAHGEKLKPVDEAKAKLLFQAMHGEGK